MECHWGPQYPWLKFRMDDVCWAMDVASENKESPLLMSWKIMSNSVKQNFKDSELSFALQVASNRRELIRRGFLMECLPGDFTMGESKVMDEIKDQLGTVFEESRNDSQWE